MESVSRGGRLEYGLRDDFFSWLGLRIQNAGSRYSTMHFMLWHDMVRMKKDKRRKVLSPVSWASFPVQQDTFFFLFYICRHVLFLLSAIPPQWTAYLHTITVAPLVSTLSLCMTIPKDIFFRSCFVTNLSFPLSFYVLFDNTSLR